MKRAWLIVFAIFAGIAALATPASAETYPSRPIRLVVPFAPGGPADFLARLVGQKLGDELGQPVVIDNRPGANTIIGAQIVAKADPDGYTLLMAIDGTLVMNPFLYSKLPYDAARDFVPIALLANVPSVLVANLKVPANTLAEMIAIEKAKPGTFLIGNTTPTSQVAIEFLNMMAGVKMGIVPFKGGTTQITAELAGDIPLGMESLNVSLPIYRDRQDQDSRAHRGAAAELRARAADYRGDLSGLRPWHLAEHRGAGRHAARDRRAAERRARQGDGDAAGARAPARGRRRAGEAQHAGGVHGLHPRAGRDARQGDQGGRHEA